MFVPDLLWKISIHLIVVMYIIFILVFPSSGSGDMDSLPKVWEVFHLLWTTLLIFVADTVIYVLFVFEQNSPGNLSMSNQPGTPREDGEMGGNFLNPFQSESVSEN